MIHVNFSRIGFLLLSTSLSVVAATYTVDMTADNIKATSCTSAADDCSLSGAMTIVASGDTIDFDLPDASVIVLDSSLPDIGTNLIIDGSDVDGLTISGNNNYRPFHINPDSNVTIQGVSIVSGSGSGTGGAIFNEGNLTIVESSLSGNTDTSTSGKGGAIYNSSNAVLSIADSNITANSAVYGGGIASYGKAIISNSTISDNNGTYGGAIAGYHSEVKILNSTISGNKADEYGGAIYSGYYSEVKISNSTISGNKADENGGAIYGSYSNLEVNSSIISGNSSSGKGGAIYGSYSNLEVNSSTISGNSSSGKGGAIYAYLYNSLNIAIKNSTISGNFATDGGAIYLHGDSGNVDISHTTVVNNKATSGGYASGGISNNNIPLVSIKNSIISGNTNASGGKDCHSSTSYYLYSAGYNIVKAPGNCVFSSTGDVTGAAPVLGPLANNGGSTKTHALITISGTNIAVDTGTCLDIADDPVPTDQRSETRPFGSECDIGAFEFGADTDSDGLDDLTEISNGTLPGDPDSDGDGLLDGKEVGVDNTDPLKFDTDGDGAGDGDEITAGTDPLDPSSFPSIGISPIEFLFGDTDGTADFVVTNNTASSTTLPTAALLGSDEGAPPTGFSIVSDGCAGSLSPGQSCTIEVGYPAAPNESISAFLQIDDVNMTAYIHNYEGIREEAMRRLPAVINDLNINAILETYIPQDLEWSVGGYDDHNYTAYTALFNCEGVAEGECGESYSSPQRFAQGLNLQPYSIDSTTTWTYKGVEMKKYNYRFTSTLSDQSNNTIPIVIRFYYKSEIDSELGLPSISTIIPGGLEDSEGAPEVYYDTSGRKISKELENPPS